jgi:transcriptional regulator with GAF, ATPase, and Fis domain
LDHNDRTIRQSIGPARIPHTRALVRIVATIQVWYRFAADSASLTARNIEQAFLRTSLSIHSPDTSDTRGPGMFFFDHVTPELSAMILEASRSGTERLIAVAVTSAAIAEGKGWALLQSGASDVLAWDHWSDPAAEIAARFERWSEVDRLVDSGLVQRNLLGSSSCWRTVLRQVVEVARFSDASVLILGESGTGKELIARLIHGLDARPDKRELVILDCTTVVPELAGSEFFGHERGAFTGAVAAREGAFALADGGTLFLDEIGDLRLPMQAQLLRAIQERTYKRIGSNRWRETRFRLICATHRPLAEQVEGGDFRADLYYRIGGVVCRIPPLRERPEDIVLLFRHFVMEFSHRDAPPDLDEPVRSFLLSRPYPGNVRELQQLAKRTSCRHVGPGPISMGDIPEDERPVEGRADSTEVALELSIRMAMARGVGLKDIGRMVTNAAIRIAVTESDGNLQQAAQRLGVTDRALQMRRASGWRSRAAEPGN